MTSTPSPVAAGRVAAPDPPSPAAAWANSARTETSLLGNAVFGIDPSCSHFLHASSNGDIVRVGAGAIGAGTPGFAGSCFAGGAGRGVGDSVDNPLCFAQYSRT